ncbi:hypothetical protein [Haloarcula salinisoli]|uniref:Uncharacterized protein n=1 Tax=Haloarcula salinisoli TaxID=2487746 RepID=A0A8J7YJ04_9EURY|nr:hypothetical protein [Halomicroarcula salinisoli]MBX0284933.1 hypothetical protein [Halomicroarcula salinisoli]MBX0303589.1 hypothetical protein [Halomicroarcula salinisoli]
MAMGQARAYGVSVLLVALGAVQLAAGTLDLVVELELSLTTAIGIGKLTVGFALLLAALYVAQLRKLGLALALLGLSGVVVVYFGPLLAGVRTPLSLGSVVFALVLMVYLFIHEDAFGPQPERELTEETNTHEFIR